MQEGLTDKNGADLTTNDCGQVPSIKPTDEHSSPVPAVKEPEETIEDIEQQV